MRSSPTDGFTLREVTDADAPAVAGVMNAYDAAFATEEVVSESDVRSWWVDIGDRGTASHALDAGGVPAGYVEIFSRGDEISMDGYVHPERFGRGLGAAFAEFARRGEVRVALGVDAENATGATQLYDRVGMHVVFHANVFRKRLA